jgi:hypothetical protein
LAAGQRTKEAQQGQEPLFEIPVEPIEQRDRQGRDVDRRHDGGHRDRREGAFGEGGTPPSAPARQRSSIKAGNDRQPRQAGRREAELHRRDQRHHGGEIDVPTQKAQRWWGGARAAAIHRAAETETLGMLLAEPGRNAARLAGIRTGMQRATAKPAPLRPGRGREVTVEDEQLFVELGVGQHDLVHSVRPLK